MQKWFSYQFYDSDVILYIRIVKTGCLKKTWWDCIKDDMESLGLSQKDAQFRNKWRRRIKGQLANPGSPGKMAVKTECV